MARGGCAGRASRDISRRHPPPEAGRQVFSIGLVSFCRAKDWLSMLFLGGDPSLSASLVSRLDLNHVLS